MFARLYNKTKILNTKFRKITLILLMTILAVVLSVLLWTVLPSKADPQSVWTLLSGTGASAVAADDIDGDGIKETVIAGKDGKIYVKKFNSSTRLTQPYPEFSIDTGMVPEIIRLYDLDGDNNKDIIVAGSSSNKVEAYSFVNNTLSQIFSTQVGSNVTDLAVGQFTDRNSTTGIDVAAVTQANVIDVVYRDAVSWKKGVSIDIGYEARRIEGFKYYGTGDSRDGMVITTVYGVRAYPFTAADNPDPLWTANNIDFTYYYGFEQRSVTFVDFGPVAVFKDIVNASDVRATDGVPEIIVGTRQQEPGQTDIIMMLNGKTGSAFWKSKGDPYGYYTILGAITDIKVQFNAGGSAYSYVAVGTGLARDAGSAYYDASHVLTYRQNNLYTPDYKGMNGTSLAGEVLSVIPEFIDHKVSGSSGYTQISAITGSNAAGTRDNKLLVWTYTTSLQAPDANHTRQLNTSVSYTLNPRSTYWLAAAAVNPQDSWKDLVFVHPGTDGAEAVTFDNQPPAINSFTISPDPVLNPWYNNVTYSVIASEGSYVKVEILRNSDSTVFRDLGWKVADFNGANAPTSVIWDGLDSGGVRYDESSCKVRVTLVDNERQFDGDDPLNIPGENENTYIQIYGPYTVNYDNTPPEITLSLYKDSGYTIPLDVYNGKPAIKPGSPVYVKVSPNAPDTLSTMDTGSVYFAVYDLYPVNRTALTADYGMGAFKGIWPLDLPAQTGEARMEVEARDSGGNLDTIVQNIIVDNTVTTPTVSATNTLGGKIRLTFGGIDDDHKQVKIYRSNVPNFTPSDKYHLLKTLDRTVPGTYEDTQVQVGQTYYYRIKQVDLAGNQAISAETSGKAVPALSFQVDYYLDPGLTEPLRQNAEGTYVTGLQSPIYVAFTSANPLMSTPTFTVDAPGTGNDISSPASTQWVSGTVYRGTWGVTVQGDGTATVKVTGTDIYGQSLIDNVPANGGTILLDTVIETPHLWGQPGPGSADLNWNWISDYSHVNIYRSTIQGFTPVDSGPGKNVAASVYGSVYHDHSLTPAQEYFYKIRAVDYAGNVSGISNELTLIPDDAGPHPEPVLLRAEPTSKQIVYLIFDEPVRITGDPASWIITQNLAGTPPSVAMAEVLDDRKVIKVVLSDSQGPGNQLTPLTYTITVTGIEDDYGISLPEDNAANRKSWEAFTPHGKFSSWSGGTIPAGSSTLLCGVCHSAHSASGASLLPAATIKKVCFICHSIGGSSDYRVEEDFVSRSVYGLPYSTSLHKSLDSDDPGFDVLSCVDCHNPHGDVKDKNLNNTIYPKLLRVTDGEGDEYYKGNQVCLACHGKDNRGFEDGAYYDATGGNHINPLDPNNINASNTIGPVHYDNVNFGARLNPESGTETTCVVCHERHGSQYGNLIYNGASNAEEGLCFKSGCHGETNPARNVYSTFYGIGIVSRHDVRGDTGRGRVECSNCHGPHTVDNANTANTGISSNPDNTKQKALSYLNSNDLCLKCHDGDPPAETRSATVIVPYTVEFYDIGFSSNSNGWDKTLAGNSGHGNSAFSVENCSRCHTKHGSQYPWLVNNNVDTDYNTMFATDSCLGLCHAYNVSWAGQDINTEIYVPFGAAYKHPTFTTNGVHSNTEQWENKDVARHAECFDCHDIHSAAAERPGVDYTETGILGWVTGVEINDWNGAVWSNWSSTTPDWDLQGLEPGVAKEYQLCLKCHSKFSYNLDTFQDSTGSAPFNTPSSSGYYTGTFRQTDVAKDFNPANPAYHAVIGETKVPQFVYNGNDIYYGKFAGGWTGDLRLRCTDCHAMEGRRGPHGSNNRFILKKPWVTDKNAANTTGKAGTEGHLCFDCHDYAFYTGADTGSIAVRSQFSGLSEPYNDHGVHGGGCASCHGGLPHGWKYTDSGGGGVAMFKASDPLPYSEGISNNAYFRSNGGVPGTWVCANCHSFGG
ncbi:MAG: hypothetical protein CVU89_11625 [Firmicutes bacterium HGW-Firmicutes-14]|nr:MAG: hypothetical protein CVU89_11625 [Firmicutes bacterium HGW-Firmicutes-14]